MEASSPVFDRRARRCSDPQRRERPQTKEPTMEKVARWWACFLPAALFGCGEAGDGAEHRTTASLSNAPPVVATQSGLVRGVNVGSVVEFRGIPYAKAPVGPRRFRPPQPPDSWNGVRDASEFGA